MSKRKKYSKSVTAWFTRHVRIHHWMMRSKAWESMEVGPRALLIELYGLYDGINNGQLFLSVREAARRLHVAPNTAGRWLVVLVDRGFIRPNERGAFTRKNRHATSWVLTEFEHGTQPPTKDFMRWQPSAERTKSKLRSQLLIPTVSAIDTDGRQRCQKTPLTVAAIDTERGHFDGPTVSRIETQVVYQDGTRNGAMP